MPLVREWAVAAIRSVDVLPPSAARRDTLERAQVSTRSPMGSVIYETGGLLVDGGWLRILGSGHSRLTRTLPGWNVDRSEGFLLVADDAIGGFFAINGGALGADVKHMYYFAPDSLEWEPLAMSYSQFLQWSFCGDLPQFYDWIRWRGWEDSVKILHGDRSFTFYPFLCTKEGKGGSGKRTDVPIEETWRLQMELRGQLGTANDS